MKIYAIKTFVAGTAKEQTACEKHLDLLKDKTVVLSAKFVANESCDFCES